MIMHGGIRIERCKRTAQVVKRFLLLLRLAQHRSLNNPLSDAMSSPLAP